MFMIELRALGQIELVGPDGSRLQSVLAQPKRLALLAYLALATPRGAHRRDTLIGLLWPELTQARARAALRNAVYNLRLSLGPGVLVGDEALELAPGAVWCDVVAFDEAIARGRPADALALYHGDLLPGFYVPDAPGFERWLDAERSRLRRRAAEAASTAATDALDAGNPDTAVELARRALDLSDGDERAFQRLASLLDGIGDRAGALRAYEQYRQWLADELGLAPSPETEELIAAIRARTEREATRGAGGVPAPGGHAASSPVSSPGTAEGPGGTPPEAAPQAVRVDPVPGAGPAPGAAEAPQGRRESARLAVPDTVTPGATTGSTAHPASAAIRRKRVARRSVGAGALAALVLAVVAFLLAGGRTPGRDAERAWVIVTDVENETGERVFDRSVPYALAAGLGQSPNLYVMPPERIRQALARMRRPDADSALDEMLAREIARREGARFIVVPSVARAGDRYEIAARLVDPESAATLAFAVVHADRADQVVTRLDRLVRRIRREAGESALAVARRSTPLPRLTTASLAALEKYATGVNAFNTARWKEARRLWEEAVAIDSTFATAHASLGMLAYWSGEPGAGEAHFARALAHAHDLPERERTLVRARIEGWRGNTEESVALLRTLYLQDSTDIEVARRLGYDLLRLGRYRESSEVYGRVVVLDSLIDSDWINLATAETGLRRYDAALTHYRRAFALEPGLLTENSNINHEFGGVFVLAGMPDSAVAVFTRLLDSTNPNVRARGLRSLAFLAMYRGRYAEASGLFAEATSLSRSTGALLSELRNRLLLATALERRGLVWDAAAQLDTSYARGVDADLDPTFVYWLGKALARAGDARRAGTLLERLEARGLPESPPVIAALEGLRGEVLVARTLADEPDASGRGPGVEEALPHLERALRADSNATALESLAHGVASAGELDRAVRLYEELAAGVEFGHENQEAIRMAPYWLGRIHERRGDPSEAAHHYERFLESWRGADPSLPVVVDARTRLARVRHRDTRP